MKKSNSKVQEVVVAQEVPTQDAFITLPVEATAPVAKKKKVPEVRITECAGFEACKIEVASEVKFLSNTSNVQFKGAEVTGKVTYMTFDPNVGKNFVRIVTADGFKLCKEASKVSLC